MATFPFHSAASIQKDPLTSIGFWVNPFFDRCQRLSWYFALSLYRYPRNLERYEKWSCPFYAKYFVLPYFTNAVLILSDEFVFKLALQICTIYCFISFWHFKNGLSCNSVSAKRYWLRCIYRKFPLGSLNFNLAPISLKILNSSFQFGGKYEAFSVIPFLGVTSQQILVTTAAGPSCHMHIICDL